MIVSMSVQEELSRVLTSSKEEGEAMSHTFTLFTYNYTHLYILYTTLVTAIIHSPKSIGLYSVVIFLAQQLY